MAAFNPITEVLNIDNAKYAGLGYKFWVLRN